MGGWCWERLQSKKEAHETQREGGHQTADRLLMMTQPIGESLRGGLSIEHDPRVRLWVGALVVAQPHEI